MLDLGYTPHDYDEAMNAVDELLVQLNTAHAENDTLRARLAEYAKALKEVRAAMHGMSDTIASSLV